MTMLYNLILIDNELSDIFNIGFFSTRELAEQTATEYLTHVQGFCEYDCGYRITEKTVADCTNGIPPKIYIVYGWNEDEFSEQMDIIESDCYLSEAAAVCVMAEMKKQHTRTEWCADCYTVNEREWKDGFVRV